MKIARICFGAGFLAVVLFAAWVPKTSGEEVELGEPPTAPEYPQALPEAGPSVLGAAALSVDPASRDASRNFYLTYYANAAQPAINWTGNIASCSAGDTAAAFKDAVVQRVNYFRAMAGVPAGVTLSSAYSANDQKAALMMSANGTLSHTPPSSWTCYTAEGATGAGNSNLSLGSYGWGAISSYMADSGAGNSAVGHRRWVLYPQTQTMGTGDIPPTSGYWSANALWVFDSNLWGPRPATREEYVAWPPPGFVPYQVVYPRWSFAYAGADFSGASVTVTQNGVNVPVTPETYQTGYGENTFVWAFNGVSSWPKPAVDTGYDVAVNNVVISGTPRNFTYRVTVFDPDVVLDTSLPPLIAFFPFEGNAKDYSGNGYDGAVNGAVLVQGMEQGQAYYFNGTTDYIHVSMNINPSIYPKLTMGAWVKPSSIDPVRQVLSCDNGGYDRSLCLDWRGGGTGWSAFCGTGGVLGYRSATLDTWVFLAVVYDQSAQTATLYVGDYGPLSKTGLLGEGYNLVRIGKNPYYGEYFHGAIDNVFFFGDALTEAQINYIRSSGAAALFSLVRKGEPGILVPLLLD